MARLSAAAGHEMREMSFGTHGAAHRVGFVRFPLYMSSGISVLISFFRGAGSDRSLSHASYVLA